MLCVIIFASGMFVGGILTKLRCHSVRVTINSKDHGQWQLRSELATQKRPKDVSVEVNEMTPPVFADWIDMQDLCHRLSN